MAAGNGLFLPILGFASCVAFIYMSFGDLWMTYDEEPKLGFVERNGTQFFLDGKTFYINGWNSYWLMDHAVEEDRRPRVGEMLQAGAKMGLTVCRAWAFNDGHYNALQISPGRFNEQVFSALDLVIAEARQHGVRLLLSLVNNLKAYGGKTQYVKWAWQEGIGLSSSNDSFFFDPSIRNYFKNYIRTILTRKNTITGIEYRDDPTIFAWELMNEPRCMSDTSGDTLQDWIEEMSAFVKSIDKNHLVTVGLEGFYGPDNPKRLTVNPEEWASRLGSDFIRNSKVSNIDFASVHIYPDHWFHDQEFEDKLKFVSKWMISHIEDGDRELKKPVLFSEYGLSNLNKDFLPSQRDKFYKTVLDTIHKSAKRKHSGAGALAWQFFVEGMDEFNDDFGIVPWERSSTYSLFTEQSCSMWRVLSSALQVCQPHLLQLTHSSVFGMNRPFYECGGGGSRHGCLVTSRTTFQISCRLLELLLCKENIISDIKLEKATGSMDFPVELHIVD
ncbi:Mannan endo-1,4-beta-mannosidase [Quillaja saponaria]|uniref:mannan endo-1,4-beta-mannosidase n=1 Tax=Quillaja saponaria TaxID=32244 RepID=A0AAD7QHB3_QUISA|nr:Mannan endo-1,4-beta-mannosidase [Quillaja saponaria]